MDKILWLNFYWATLYNENYINTQKKLKTDKLCDQV